MLRQDLKARAAARADAAAIATIYNQGIEDRIATFETEPRSPAQIEAWFDRDIPVVVVEAEDQVVGYAAAFAYSDRCCYAGVSEFTVSALR